MSVEANTVNNGKRRQSRVQKRLLETTGIASLLVCFGSLVSPADAACGPNNNPTYNAPVTCTTTNANANLTMAGPSTVTVTDAPGTQDAVRSQVNGNTGNATMTLNDVTVINNDLTYPSIGVYVLIADFTTPTGNGVLNMTGTNNVTTANGTTVEVNVRGTGSATMNLSGTLNVTSLVTNTDDNDGIESTTHNGGASTINMAQASGVVSVKGGNGILIDSLASGGNISGNIGSGMTINLDNTIAGANNALNPNSGIYTFTQATGTINLTTGAAINTTGNRADGIRAVAVRGQVSVTNTGAIATTGTNSRGIEIATTAGPNGPGGPITANNSGAITTSGLTSSGILATSTDGNLSITNSGAINTSGQQSHGIQATTANAGTSTVSTAAAINARGLQSVGIYALGSTSSVTVDAGGSVSGGWEPSSVSPPSAGVAIGSTGGAKTLTNNGTIGALSDRAIAELDRFVVGVASPLTIVNNGNITGYIQLGGGDATFRNLTPNSFDIRHFADTNGDGIRDTKRVAISRFGTGNDTFLNETNGTVRLAPVAGAAVTETIGYAVPTTGIDSRPLEASFYDFNREGLLQGQLTNLETFDNAGTIDLRGSVVGNTLLITGGPGVDGVLLPGNGVFISDGGKLLVNAMLNAGIPLAGQTNSYSDMLIVDSTQLGAGGPTAITVTNVGGSGALTPGNGIEVVEVRNKTASVAGAFALNGDYVTKDSQQAVVGGAFAYTLHHNGVGGDTADGNWYLRSQIVPTPPGPTPPNPPNPPEPPQPRYQPGVPIYEVYPQNLLALAAVPTMQQRVGNRYWTEPAPAPETVFCKDASQNFQCPVTGAQAQYYAGAAVG
ncbi:autotransporter outer membrane beta-barrel domain-containing protein, partial [Aminobacter sp. AP02]|uniref:autotransporter outer membrane beta-barrel domain-containing protein n=1 Tax=Aminobacter sp. AP02 TaxID=2135737 RepID=UPI001304AEE4